MIKYALSVDIKSRCFRVSMEFEAHGSPNVSMPVWTPGSYLIREFSRNVRFLKASEGGKPLDVQKVSKNSWRISGVRKRVRVEYDVYAHEHTTNSSYIGSEHATINGASVFLFPEGMETGEIEVRINRPKGWKKMSTGLPKRDGKLYAKNYDTLVDSPIEVGNHRLYSFIAGGKRHEVAIYSHGKFDEKRFVNDLKKIVNASFTVFRDAPYDRYVFICHFVAGPEYGGLEHMNSTLCIAPVLSMKNDSDYKNTLGLFSHEFFHLWNVKRLRPRPLGPFDYSRENYTTSLWISEGITSYYDNLILRRAGIISPAEYLIELSEEIGRFLSTPGRNVQSAEESSFDAWIKFYRPDEESANSTISYYNKGAIIGWLIDMELRRCGKSLDDAMRVLYRETFRRGKWFEPEEFVQACEKVSGKPFGKFFMDYAKGAGKIDFQGFLSYAGLVLGSKNGKTGKFYIGVKVRGENGKTSIREVLDGSPARKAGIFAGDDMLGVDGLRLGPEELRYAIENCGGEWIEIMVSRMQKIERILVKPVEKPQFEKRIFAGKARKPQRELFRKWIGGKWGEIEYKEPPVSLFKKPFFSYI